MSYLLLDGTYGYAAIVVSLMAGSAFYFRRSAKIAYVLRAWVLIVAALLVLAFGAIASLARLAALDSLSAIEQTIQQAGPIMYAVHGAYGVSVSALLFFAIFELARTFRRAQDARLSASNKGSNERRFRKSAARY